MKNTILLKVIVLFALGMAGVPALPLFAQHSGHSGYPSAESAPKAWFGKVEGQIVQLDQNSIILERQKKGRVERVVLLISQHTKVEGELKLGAKATVNYREEYGNRTATRIRVKKDK